MAQRTITHFKVAAALMNEITALLLELPAKSSRDLLNRIESPGECEPMFKVDLANTSRNPPARKKRTRKVRNPPARKKKAGQKVARKKRSA